MNSSPNRASHPHGKPRRKEINFDLSTARQMLPLVRSIVSDIVDQTQRLAQLTPEQQTLDEYRRLLNWASRQRRYTIQDEMEQAQKHLSVAVKELNSLGVTLVDSEQGQVDFPTRINSRPAAFSWLMGEDALDFWRYSGESHRRPIPADWQHGTPLRSRSKP